MPDSVTNDFWIMSQLARIQRLEEELSDAFNNPVGRTNADLQRRLHQLNSRVNIVDVVLSSRASNSRKQIIGRRPSVAGMRPSAAPLTA
jgi:hypothetical protein